MRVNGDPMCARFQCDMSAESEKICDRFTDFPTSGSILQTKRMYPSLRKMADVESKPARKKSRLMKRRSTFLYHIGRNIPAFFDKASPNHKDQNKRDIARQQIAESLNEAFDYEKGADKFITGIFEF